MPKVSPLLEGNATRIGENAIECTFALSEAMQGWKMVSAQVDESGYMLNVRWERE